MLPLTSELSFLLIFSLGGGARDRGGFYKISFREKK